MPAIDIENKILLKSLIYLIKFSGIISVVPTIEAGNALFKMMVYFMGACAAGIVLGAEVYAALWLLSGVFAHESPKTVYPLLQEYDPYSYRYRTSFLTPLLRALSERLKH